MSIYPDGSNEEQEETVQPKPRKVPDSESVTVNRRHTPLSGLLTHIEGFAWQVTFYHQLLGENDNPQPHEPTLDPTLQQYHRIREFEIRVSDPLTYQNIASQNIDALSGEGVVFPGTVIPQFGDTFVADIGDGRSGIFTIHEVEPRSIMMERAYSVRYYLQSSSTQTRLDDLKAKSVQKSFFIKDFLQVGRNPILEEQETIDVKHLQQQRIDLINHYANQFADLEYRHLLVPEQKETVFDYFLAEYWQRTIDISQIGRFREMNWPDVRSLRRHQRQTLWDLLSAPSPAIEALTRGDMEERMVMASVWTVRTSPFFTNIYYSRVQQLIWPHSQRTDATAIRELQAGETLKAYHDLTVGGHVPADYDPETEPVSGIEKPLIYAVTADDYYIFSQAFYDGNLVEQSALEYYTSKFLMREPLPASLLKDLVHQVETWNRLEQFYYIPILLRLMDYVIAEPLYE